VLALAGLLAAAHIALLGALIIVGIGATAAYYVGSQPSVEMWLFFAFAAWMQGLFMLGFLNIWPVLLGIVALQVGCYAIGRCVRRKRAARAV
jgi:hypothetical protein